MAQNTTQNPYARFFSTDFFKGMAPAGALFPIDFGAILETQRKNIQAVTEAQQLVVENLQVIAQRQAKILSQIVEDNTSIAQQIMTDGTPEEKVSRQADMVRDAYERSVSNAAEIADLVSKSNRESGEIINKRVAASLSEFKSTIEKSMKEKEKKAA